MGLSTIGQLFSGSWGIVEGRRAEIEFGSHGVFDRIYEEEVCRNFLSIRAVAQLFDCHESTARNWLTKSGARFIVRDLSHLYFMPDVAKTKTERQTARKPAA